MRPGRDQGATRALLMLSAALGVAGIVFSLLGYLAPHYGAF